MIIVVSFIIIIRCLFYLFDAYFIIVIRYSFCLFNVYFIIVIRFWFSRESKFVFFKKYLLRARWSYYYYSKIILLSLSYARLIIII